MKYLWVLTALIVTSLLLSSCAQGPAETAAEDPPPAVVEHLEGTDPTRITLTEEAAKRLDIQTAAVHDMQVGGTQQTVIPYAAIIYDTQGATWAYTNPEPLIFVRVPITVDHIEGDRAFLTLGPPSGSAVVTVGVAELYGSESEFEEE